MADRQVIPAVAIEVARGERETEVVVRLARPGAGNRILRPELRAPEVEPGLFSVEHHGVAGAGDRAARAQVPQRSSDGQVVALITVEITHGDRSAELGSDLRLAAEVVFGPLQVYRLDEAAGGAENDVDRSSTGFGLLPVAVLARDADREVVIGVRVEVSCRQGVAEQVLRLRDSVHPGDVLMERVSLGRLQSEVGTGDQHDQAGG